MGTLNLSNANRIIEAALAKAASLSLNPLGVVVLDAGGHPIASQRQDGATFLRLEVATAKAYGAVALGISSRAIEKRAIDRPHFFQGLAGLAPIVPVAGGVLVRDRAGSVLGSVGISGDTSDNDELCAVTGIEAAGLVADAKA
jgi:uncharacterized protein GlcG (DUF336 family)